MGTTTTLVTVQEFLALPEPQGERIELIGGEVVSMPRAGYLHEITKSNLLMTLVAWSLHGGKGRVFSETAFQLDEHNSPIPDVSYFVSSSGITAGTTGLIHGAPDLAIEVVSSETAARLEEKIELYLAHGSKSVWVVYPEQQVVWIYDVSGNARKFERSQTLEDPTVLPGFSTPVSGIFGGV